jgi:hypothetical protein
MPSRFFSTVPLLLAVLLFVGGQSSPLPKKMEPELLRQDLQIAHKSLEDGHSGIYRYTPKPELDAAFDAASRRLDHPMNSMEFLRILAPAVAKIKCGHTSVRPPKSIDDALDETFPEFPLDVVVLGDGVYVTREYLPDTQNLAGLRIQKINGMPTKGILDVLLRGTPGDGDSRTARPSRISDSFPWYLYVLGSMEAPFHVDFDDPKSGKTISVELSGITFRERQKVAAIRYPQDREPEDTADLKFKENDHIATLTVRGFYGKAEKEELSDYFDDAFKQIQLHKSATLIIDVRDNGGGRDFLGKKLLSFLVDTPFFYYNDLVYNGREFDFFRYADDAKPIPDEMVEKRTDGKFHDIKHANLGIQQPSQPHFGGKVIVLMNGGSFSTTCEFLSNLHDKKRGIFVGEEAGGGYYGNTSGPSVAITLPNTKVRVRIPLRTYYLAVKDGQPNRSILPDYGIAPTIGDLLSRKDPVMERAIELARSGS